MNKTNPSRGTRNGRAKLDEWSVWWIRQLAYQNHPVSYIARQFSVTPAHVRRIVRRESWKDIP